MAKLAQTSVKYLIKIEFSAEGIVEKPDIIGALFGQTEGLLGSDMDLRELQRIGRIGRIDVNVKVSRGKSSGEIFIPSSLTNTETALIAATLETIERVGPCDAKLKVFSVEDIRSVKRSHIKKRAQELLHKLKDTSPEIAEITDEINDSLRIESITTYKGLPAGPGVKTSEDIILCEGRADVVNILKAGINNALALGGTNIPSNIKELTKEREVTLYLDGDRGGDLILKAISSVIDVDFVARAPEGKEVEELTHKEIHKSLREKVPLNQAKSFSGASLSATGKKTYARDSKTRTTTPRSVTSRSTTTRSVTSKPITSRVPAKGVERKTSSTVSRGASTERRGSFNTRSVSRSTGTRTFTRRPQFDSEPRSEKVDDEAKENYKKQLEELMGTRAASIYDKNKNFSGRVPVKELAMAISQVSNPKVIIMDGKLERKVCMAASDVGVSVIVCNDKETGLRTKINVLSEKDL